MRIPKYICFKIIILAGDRYKYGLVRPSTPREKLIKRAVRAGNIRLLGTITPQEAPLFNKMLARVGNDLIFTRDFDKDQIFSEACKYNRIEFIKKLYNKEFIGFLPISILTKHTSVFETIAELNKKNDLREYPCSVVIEARSAKYLNVNKLTVGDIEEIVLKGTLEMVKLCVLKKEKKYTTRQKEIYVHLVENGYDIRLITPIKSNFNKNTWAEHSILGFSEFDTSKRKTKKYLRGCTTDAKLPLGFIKAFKYNPAKAEQFRIQSGWSINYVFCYVCEKNYYTLAEFFYSEIAVVGKQYTITRLLMTGLAERVIMEMPELRPRLLHEACTAGNLRLVQFLTHKGTNIKPLLKITTDKQSIQKYLKRYK